MKSLLIDDLRNIDADVVCRTFEAGIHALKNLGPFGVLWLDHDLGELEEDGSERHYLIDDTFYVANGYGIMCFLEDHPEYLPVSIKVVSSNPVGRRRMQTVIDRLYKKD